MAKNKGGRPLKYKTAAELQKKIDEYFTNCPDKRVIEVFDKKNGEFVQSTIVTPTITGLGLFLGFVNRASFYDYENRGEFSDTIKKARYRIENEYEKQLYNGQCTGAIFALKNLGWRDKAEPDNKDVQQPTITINGVKI